MLNTTHEFIEIQQTKQILKNQRDFKNIPKFLINTITCVVSVGSFFSILEAVCALSYLYMGFIACHVDM